MNGPDPSRHLAGGSPSSVVVPARVARFLDRHIGGLRAEVRGNSAELDAVLAALHIAGIQYVETAAEGRTALPKLDDLPISTRGFGRPQLDVLAVAELLGCKPRNVRDLAARGRLHGEHVGRQWLFHREDVDQYLADRALAE